MGSGSNTGSEQGTGNGSSGSSLATDSGIGAGQGSGTGDGEGTIPFDIAGFANAVEANKQYPYQAIKRSQEGSVTMSINIGSSGALQDVTVISSSGSNLLENAAMKAVANACPYDNPTGAQVHFTTTLHFYLN